MVSDRACYLSLKAAQSKPSGVWLSHRELGTRIEPTSGSGWDCKNFPTSRKLVLPALCANDGETSAAVNLLATARGPTDGFPRQNR
jgi:hypothetical protein